VYGDRPDAATPRRYVWPRRACYHCAMAALKLLLGVLVAFGGFVALMYVAQRSLMYFPDRERVPPAAAGLPSAEEVALDSAGAARSRWWSISTATAGRCAIAPTASARSPPTAPASLR
jgi:hypothetical protein